MFKAETYDRALEMTRIFNIAVRKAQESHRKNGLPSVYTKNGKAIWEMPDGSYVTENPFKDEKKNKCNISS